MLFVSWLIAVMFSLMNLRKCRCLGLDAVIKRRTAPTRNDLLHIKRIFEGLSFQQSTNHCGPLQIRNFCNRDLADIDLSKNYIKTATRWLQWPWSRKGPFAQEADLEEAYPTLADSADCVLRRVRQLTLKFGHRVWKWQGH